jgi:hypothetical protein
VSTSRHASCQGGRSRGRALALALVRRGLSGQHTPGPHSLASHTIGHHVSAHNCVGPGNPHGQISILCDVAQVHACDEARAITFAMLPQGMQGAQAQSLAQPTSRGAVSACPAHELVAQMRKGCKAEQVGGSVIKSLRGSLTLCTRVCDDCATRLCGGDVSAPGGRDGERLYKNTHTPHLSSAWRCCRPHSPDGGKIEFTGSCKLAGKLVVTPS